LGDGRHLSEGQSLIDVGLEEILDHRGTVDRLGLRMLDIVDGRLCDALGEQDDAIRDFFRQDAGVAPEKI